MNVMTGMDIWEFISLLAICFGLLGWIIGAAERRERLGIYSFLLMLIGMVATTLLEMRP